MLEKLKAQRADVEKRFSEVSARLDALVKQRADLDRAIAAGRDSQLSLRGEYKAIEDMIKAESAPPSVPVDSGPSGTGDGEAN